MPASVRILNAPACKKYDCRLVFASPTNCRLPCFLFQNTTSTLLPKPPDKLVSFCNTRKENTVLNRLHISHSYLTHSFILKRQEAPVCVACGAVITVKRILIECADLLEIRKKYFEERSLYSLFRNVIPEIIFFISCERLVCFRKYEVC